MGDRVEPVGQGALPGRQLKCSRPFEQSGGPVQVGLDGNPTMGFGSAARLLLEYRAKFAHSFWLEGRPPTSGYIRRWDDVDRDVTYQRICTGRSLGYPG